MQDRQKQMPAGFTLIEMLTVVAIIAMVMAIFSVGTRKIRIISFGLQQKSVFHAITVGLEVFRNDFDGYPDSDVREAGGYAVTGAQHMTEALLGRDQLGFEPRTGWFPMADALFNPNAPADLYRDPSTSPASQARRKGPYCEVKYGQPMEILELWQDRGSSTIYAPSPTVPPWQRSPVITDVFSRNDTESGRQGSPILYFKADPTKRFRVDASHQPVSDASYTDAEYRNWIFNFNDNLPILRLAWLRDTTQNGINVHYQDPDGLGRNPARMFYEQITQQADPDRGFFKPYNSPTFILISAGWDGIFGTKEDIVNFN